MVVCHLYDVIISVVLGWPCYTHDIRDSGIMRQNSANYAQDF